MLQAVSNNKKTFQYNNKKSIVQIKLNVNESLFDFAFKIKFAFHSILLMVDVLLKNKCYEKPQW